MWPNWSGETAVIVATGPSAGNVPLDIGTARSIAIKSSWKLIPRGPDVLYGLDRGWWIENRGVPKFNGLKVSPSPTVRVVYGTMLVRLRPRAEILMDEFGTIGCGLRTGGGHSGFQAINLAVQFGAKRIVLVGFDMTLSHGAHANPDQRGVGKPDAKRVESWRASLDGCAAQFKSLGVEVVNTCAHSALTAFPKMSLAEALGVKNGGSGQDHAVQPELQIRRSEDLHAGSADQTIR